MDGDGRDDRPGTEVAVDNRTGPVVVRIDGAELRPGGTAHHVVGHCPVGMVPPIGVGGDELG
jgi:hypothetical protein